MPGKIQNIIRQIVEQRAGGNQVLVNTTLTKLRLKGIDVDKFNETSPDDPATISKLIEIAKQLNTILKF